MLSAHDPVIMRTFDEIKHRHILNEVGDVAEGKYDWKICKMARENKFIHLNECLKLQ